MEIKDIFFDSEIIVSNTNLNGNAKGIKCDSRKVEKGDIFFSFSKQKEQNLMFCEKSLKKGAICVVSEFNMPNHMPFIMTNNIRKNFALACKNFYKKACDKLKIIAVTGTNGKTTTTYFLKSILTSAYKNCGIIGTNGAIWNDKNINTEMTTPDSDELHKIFSEMLNDKIEYVIMEASAHAIYLDKLYGLNFEGVIFTNISQDHLDYFANMKNYVNAKLKILNNGIKYLVVNNSLKNLFKENAYFYGTKSDMYLPHEEAVLVNSKDKIYLNMKGRHNAENAFAAIKMAELLNIDKTYIIKGIENLKEVPGRFNEFNYNNIKIICDYAHTPDALEKVLLSIKESSSGKIITVFGCGGDRDRLKRPIMGKVASKLSDICVITSDNPRSENPLKIIEEISEGVQGNYIIEENRKKAIFLAIHMAAEGDCVLIAGKGCENYQEINSIKYPYSDYKCIEEIICK